MFDALYHPEKCWISATIWEWWHSFNHMKIGKSQQIASQNIERNPHEPIETIAPWNYHGHFTKENGWNDD